MVIYKFHLNKFTPTFVTLSFDAMPLKVDVQDAEWKMWVLLDQDKKFDTQFKVQIFGTGHDIGDDKSLIYINTFNFHELVLHAFYKKTN